jgi:hypothetical protein
VIVAGANIVDAFYSNDGGYTWSSRDLSDRYGVWGDPCIVADTAGRFYFCHLAQDLAVTNVWPRYCDRVLFQTSEDGGASWDTCTFAGFNLPKMQDKAWMAIDPKTNYAAVGWTQFDNYGSLAITDSSRIYFSISKDGGRSWSSGIVLSSLTGDCLDSSATTEGAVPAFGVNGELYIVWAFNDSIYFNKSLDYGNTWLNHEIAIAAQPTGWNYNIAGLNRCNGMPYLYVDQSNSPYRGSLYVNWTDKRNGPADADVFFMRSTDGGNTWQPVVRVNDDAPGRENFMSAMAVDQVNGDIYILYYDRRNYSDINTDVYMAYSTDGGSSFTNVKVSSTPFYPDDANFFGDYIGISARNGCVRPGWMRMDNGVSSAWTAIINKNQLSTAVSALPVEEGFQLVSSNPTTSQCIIHYDGKQPFDVTITDLSGKPVFHQQNKAETFYTRLNELGLSNGTYLVSCRSEVSERVFKVVYIK